MVIGGNLLGEHQAEPAGFDSLHRSHDRVIYDDSDDPRVCPGGNIRYHPFSMNLGL